MTTPKFELKTLNFGDYTKTAIVRVEEEPDLINLSHDTQQYLCDMDGIIEGDEY